MSELEENTSELDTVQVEEEQHPAVVKRYKKKWESIFAWVTESPDNEGNAYCTYCDAVVSPHKSHLVSHERTKLHTSLTPPGADQTSHCQDRDLEAYNNKWENQFSWLIRSPDNEQNAYCFFCKLEIKPLRSHLVSHEKTKLHARMTTDTGDQLSYERPMEVELPKGGYNKKWERQFSWLKRSRDNPRNAFCLICKMEIKPNKSSLVSHERTKLHARRLLTVGDPTGKQRLMEVEPPKTVGGYRKKWESIFCWLRESPDNKRYAYCIFCKTDLKPHKSHLVSHEKTKIHVRMAESSGGQINRFKSAGAKFKPSSKSAINQGFTLNSELGKISVVPGESVADTSQVDFSLLAEQGISLTYVPKPPDLGLPNQLENPLESTTKDLTVVAGTTMAGHGISHHSQDGHVVNLSGKNMFSYLYEEVATQLRTASRFDTLWFCNDGCYKVHKVVIASASPFLRQILEKEPEEQHSVIFTPDFNSSVIKPIIYLFYTGNVNVAENIMGEVKTALQLFEFKGELTTVAVLNQEIGQQEAIMDEMEKNGLIASVPSLLPATKSKYREDTQALESSLLDSFFNIIDGSGNLNLKGEIFSDVDYSEENMETFAPEKKVKKKLKKRGRKVLGDYLSDEDGDSDEDYGVVKRGRGRPKKVKTENGDDSLEGKPARKKSGKKSKSNKEGDYLGEWSDDKENNYQARKPSWKFLGKCDTSEMYRTRGPGKDERTLQLSEALFDGQQLDFIYTCIACYSVFEYDAKLEAHKHEAHPEGVKPGEFHTSQENEYQCPKCRDIIAVKHLAWFCKHVKYCGENNEIANDLITPGEDSSDCDDEAYFEYKKKTTYVKNTPERMQITVGKTGRNMQILSKALTKKLVKFIWGCSLCYTVHLSEEDLVEHKREKHQGEDVSRQGSCWNAHSQNYTCPHCKKIQNCRHLVWFIYHMHKCQIALSGSSTIPNYDINAEEESDEEDNNEDGMDPEGILFRTYKIKGVKSEWICEGLFGKILEHLYPCHVCYTVLPTAQELQEHFMTCHPNRLNRLENGPYYRKDEQCFSCPVCLKNVCTRKSNSIFFTFHFRKCNNQTFPVQRKCSKCSKELNSLSAYRDHLESSCQTKNVMCHFCTKCFTSNATLNHHIRYVHRTDRPFQCHMCDKNYKFNCELKVHIKTAHSLHYNYSCENCGKQFYGKKGLSRHMAIHLPEAERKYGCSLCGRRFTKKKTYTQHLTTHSEVRHFSCEICGASVKTRDTLKQHRRKVHKLFTPVPKANIPHSVLLSSLGDPVAVKEEVVEEAPIKPFDEVESACAAIIELAS